MAGFLQQKDGYRRLRVYKVAEIIYDLTFYFAKKYLSRGDRTVDQMIQAARSGKQNIAEGSAAGTTSAEMEIKLTNVALASQEELLLDYQDYLRVRKMEHWGAHHPRYQKMREYVKTAKFENEYGDLMDRLNDEALANLCITLIYQAIYMLKKLLEAQQKAFLEQGGVREQMTRARLEARGKK